MFDKLCRMSLFSYSVYLIPFNNNVIDYWNFDLFDYEIIKMTQPQSQTAKEKAIEYYIDYSPKGMSNLIVFRQALDIAIAQTRQDTIKEVRKWIVDNLIGQSNPIMDDLIDFDERFGTK